MLVISGGFLSIMLQYYFNVSIPWIIFSAIFTAGAMFMMFRGVAVSTKLAGFFFAFEMMVLLVVSIAVLIKNGGHLSSVPFEPSHITNDFSGLALAFPLAIYLFIGWENSAALAEETNNPRRNVPRAVFLSIALMAVHVPAAGLRHGHRLPLQRDGAHGPPIPFISRRPQRGGLAGLHRLPGRADLHPGRAHRRGELPVPADLQRRPRGPAAALDRPGPPGPPDAGQRHHRLRRHRRRPSPWSGRSATGSAGTGNSLSALNFFFESSTMGTILILFVYLAANVALPFYYRKYRPAEFNVIKHVVLPVLGMVVVAVPIYYLFKPPQPQPYDWFPWVAVGLIVVSILYSIWLVRRDPGLGDRVGSIIADE